MVSAVRSWKDVEEVVETSLLPTFDRRGEEIIAELRAARSPAARAALVEIDSRWRLGLLKLISGPDLVEGVRNYLARPGGFEHEWAWYGLCDGVLAPEERWDLVMALVDVAPDDDESLWLIGDGPIASIENDAELLKRLEIEEQSNPRLARIRQLVEDRLHGR